jgi:hypothetical protein
VVESRVLHLIEVPLRIGAKFQRRRSCPFRAKVTTQ